MTEQKPLNSGFGPKTLDLANTSSIDRYASEFLNSNRALDFLIMDFAE
jgi:hypothetical protein